jgi:hypothetical protein
MAPSPAAIDRTCHNAGGISASHSEAHSQNVSGRAILPTSDLLYDGVCAWRTDPPRMRCEFIALACCAAVVVMLSAGACLAQDRSEGTRASALGATTVAGPSPHLEVPSVVIGAPASETSLGISIGRDATLPSNTYIRIRGMSPMLALTSGHVIAPGAWAVAIAALPDLRLVIPAGAAGKTDVHVALVAIDGGVVAEAKTTLIISGAALGGTGRTKQQSTPSAPSAVVTAAPSVVVLPPSTPPNPRSPPARTGQQKAVALSDADRERAESLLDRGRKLLASGNIASARLFFQRAADAGLADGALAMGDTFDPIELSRLDAIGIHPDPSEARHWYEKARELGAAGTADRRLERLGAR